jgi:hypothetical protein
MDELIWVKAPTDELINGYYAWFDPVTPDGVSGFEVAQGGRGWGVAFRGGSDNSWYIPAVDGLATMPEATAVAQELYEYLCRANPAPAASATKAAPSKVSVAHLVRSDEDSFAFETDAAFWQMDLIANNERFDLLVRDAGALILRACPYTEAQYRASSFDNLHADDPEFIEGSECGLTKWTCAGCGTSTIAASIDDFPKDWFEIAQKKADGDTLAYEVVCTIACAAAFAHKGVELRPVRLPGFAPAHFQHAAEKDDDDR